MVMVRPSEIHVGSIGDAPVGGLSLLLPRSRYDLTILIASVEGRRIGVFLNDPNQVDAIEWTESTHPYEGILVPGVSIELDAQSAFDPRAGNPPGGSLIREADLLKIVAGFSGNRFARFQRFPLLGGLPPCAEHEAAGFRNWRIIIGEGDDKRELFSMNIPEPKEN